MYDYAFENTHALPIIDTNERKNIIPERLLVNGRIGINLRRESASLYSLRLEIGCAFSILEEVLKCENILYTMNMDYDTAIHLYAIA